MKQIKTLAEELNVIKFQEVSSKERKMRDAYDMIIEVCQEPSKGLHEDSIQKIKAMSSEGEWSAGWITGAFVILSAMGAAAYFGWKKYGSRLI